MKTIVISASASLQEAIKKWADYWHNKGYTIIDYPKPIDQKNFSELYPIIHTEFYNHLTKTSFHFIANATKNGIEGYIGPGVFAEIAFRVGLNLTTNLNVPVILLSLPTKECRFYEDIILWNSLGWIKTLDDFS